MAGSLQIKHGTKIQVAYDVPPGQQPQFNMICTFNKALDESAFLVSIPIVDGNMLIPGETQKLLFRYGEGNDQNLVAGYVDDVVKEGIRRYWKVRRVAEQRQFIQRCDIRLKVQIPVSYMQDTWALNTEGKIEKESGETIDISNNGMAVYMNHWFDVGESCIFTLPRLGNAGEGEEELEVAGVICWMRELPKGGAFRFATGVQLHFGSIEEGRKMQEYVAYVKKRYRL
ncbi:PilZ domain-containing protein [Mediterraneibacter faecis]|uniref:PilZ domain-containing protein n=1 Tax=Fusicatenibacter saccharivorans TaxID=1150298 RepID=UPI003F8D945B